MKPNELLTLNKAELEGKARELKEELFNLRFQLATGQLQNTMVIKETAASVRAEVTMPTVIPPMREAIQKVTTDRLSTALGRALS